MKKISLLGMYCILITFLFSTSSLPAQQIKGKVNQTAYRDFIQH